MSRRLEQDRSRLRSLDRADCMVDRRPVDEFPEIEVLYQPHDDTVLAQPAIVRSVPSEIGGGGLLVAMYNALS